MCLRTSLREGVISTGGALPMTIFPSAQRVILRLPLDNLMYSDPSGFL